MFLINSKNKIRVPTELVTISNLADPTIVNPETLSDDFKLVAPRSHLYIVDRNTMNIVKKQALNFHDLTPYDIFSDITGKRYIAIAIPQIGDPVVINALDKERLKIFFLRQPFRITKNKLYINDMCFTPDRKNELVTFERIKFNKINATIQLCCNSNIRHVIQYSAQDFERRDPKLYNAVGLKIPNFGEIRFLDINRYQYSTNALSAQQYDIQTNYTGPKQPGLIDVFNDITQTLNTIAEIEKLAFIMSGRIPQGYADLSQTLFSMSLPSLAALSLVTRIHYEQNVDNIPAKISDEMFDQLRSDRVLGQYLSKTLVRKAYRLVRRLRINYLKGLHI